MYFDDLHFEGLSEAEGRSQLAARGLLEAIGWGVTHDLSKETLDKVKQDGFIMKGWPCFCRSWREPLSMVFA